ncbi:signal recognition particle-docking protein FtsY [Halorhodospira abdelmalekii]|uniref:signal recognition particle-docking protein FtsY n=1 Tax=Halorhodospira abdelmalekii TaxID=421629 RepID=UPI001908FF27|nr:signal recognition particle-docking protein FtsY [Halorhodospira abdelmalekii]MBK1734407.1 signal recognition particle-docking protein FtsY [Halorhodospira abdelmalekii]
MSDEQSTGQRRGLMGRLRNSLKRTRSGLTDGLAGVFSGRRRLDDEMLEELEARLLSADVGIEATETVLNGLLERFGRAEIKDGSSVFEGLQEEIAKVLEPVAQPLRIDAAKRPFVILTVGVNGAGKTTTIGKLASRLQQEGRSVMLAAGDTFRAAAVEQLKQWGEQIDCPVIAQSTGADSASVVYDAYEAARARGVDVLIADTAGRLHTQANLMEELRKIRRVLARQDTASPHETLLVLDGGNGQNALAQAEKFGEAVQVSGLVVTKLDGTARGGVLLALAQRLRVPVRYIGVGEGVEDLRPFDAKEFAAALATE